jgi:DNA-binding protein H-NS
MLVALRENNSLVEEALLPSSPTFPAQSRKKISSWDLSSLSVDELWGLREQVGALLTGRISGELKLLKQRLEQLKSQDHGKACTNGNSESPESRKRRSYPPVLPKYQNPCDLSEIWSGRGKQPRWLIAQLVQGKALDDFRISNGAAS